jgi:hypothetical protein
MSLARKRITARWTHGQVNELIRRYLTVMVFPLWRPKS